MKTTTKEARFFLVLFIAFILIIWALVVALVPIINQQTPDKQRSVAEIKAFEQALKTLDSGDMFKCEDGVWVVVLRKKDDTIFYQGFGESTMSSSKFEFIARYTTKIVRKTNLEEYGHACRELVREAARSLASKQE